MNGYITNIFQNIRSMMRALKQTLPHFTGLSSSYREMTEEYPDRLSARMPEDLPIRFRGLLNNDIEKCSGCRYCVDVCPTDCIRIDTEAGPEPNVSWVAVFDIDHSKCVFCGFCVDVCPTKSLKHTKEYQASAYHLPSMITSYGRGFASREMKQGWLSEQMAKEAIAEELAQLEQNPVAAEIRKRMRIKEDQK